MHTENMKKINFQENLKKLKFMVDKNNSQWYYN